jgi:hypothetical protein
LLEESLEGKRIDARDVYDGEILRGKSECAHTHSLLRRNITHVARFDLNCFTNGSLSTRQDGFAMCGDRGGGEEILVQNTASHRFVACRMGASKPFEKLEIGDPVGTGDLILSGAPTAGKPAGNNSSDKDGRA